MHLYPPIKPYKKGYFERDGHKIYYEACGNPDGKPVLYLHGGPGGGIMPSDRRYFNPRKFNIILFDQRGSGKSRPYAGTKNNTTRKLIEDIEFLLKRFSVKKVILFGGSWGSTLALVYAIKHKKRVSGMVLRGIFFCDSEDNSEFFGGHSANLFPEAWERFLSNVPKRCRKNPAAYYAKQFSSRNAKTKNKFAKEWSRYESSICALNMTERKINKRLRSGRYKAIAPLECHYLSNLCFLPDNFIRKNAAKLSGIPTVIIHGRYDAVCRPLNAYRLHKLIRGSRLYFVTAGHVASEKEIQKKLVEEINKMAKQSG